MFQIMLQTLQNQPMQHVFKNLLKMEPNLAKQSKNHKLNFEKGEDTTTILKKKELTQHLKYEISQIMQKCHQNYLQLFEIYQKMSSPIKSPKLEQIHYQSPKLHENHA